MKRSIALLAAAMPVVWCGATETTTVALDSVQTLDELEVVATRATASTPVAYTNVTAGQIEKNNTGVDVPYLLMGTPSVISTSDAGAGVGYTSIRVRGTDGSRINVTTNGVPVNDAESHNVYWVNMPDLASSLKDVQIQRGAGTSTNGAGAFGASINMQTMTAPADAYGEFYGAYGSYNTNKQTVRAGTGLLGGHWAVDTRISHIGSDGYIERASSRLWSYLGQAAYYDGGTSLKLLAFGGKERTYHAWDYATKEQIEKYGRRYNPCGEYTDAQGHTAYYPDQYDNYITHNLQLIYNQSIGSDWHLNVALHYTKGDGYYEQYKTSQKFKKYGLVPYYEDDTKIDRSDLIRQKKMDNGFGGGIFALRYSHGAIDATVGGGLNNYSGSHIGEITWVRNYVGKLDPKQQYYRNDADKLDGNIYARADLVISKQLSGYADVQYRHIDYKIEGVGDTYHDAIAAMQQLDIHRHFNFFNPKAGVNLNIDKHNRAYASVSVAHREPTRDNFIDCIDGRTPVPERMIDYEAGYTFAGGIFSATANLYYMDYKNQLVATGRISDTGNTVSENVPDSYRAGIELQTALKPARCFDWQFTATLSRNRIKNYEQYIYGDDAPMIVRHKSAPIVMSPSFTLHNALNFGMNGFSASLMSRFVSRQYLDNSGSRELSLDPYFVCDLHLGYDFGKIASLKNLNVGVVVYNIFNEKYESNGWAYSYYYTNAEGKQVLGSDAGYAVQAPVHVMATVSLKF